MQQHVDQPRCEKAGWVFHFTAVALLLGAIGATLVEKQREAALAAQAAGSGKAQRGESDEWTIAQDQFLRGATQWQGLGFLMTFLAIPCWAAAVWRGEKLCWSCAVSLLLVYLALQLMFV